MKQCNNRNGFTLIELLIVIAVLGVLAAGVIIAINPIGMINSANIAKGKTFSASVENDLAINQVGKWSFNDSASPGLDTSGYGNNGTLSASGVTWQNTSQCGLGLGGCLSFNGSGYVDVDLSLVQPDYEYTISIWINPSNKTSLLFKRSHCDGLIMDGSNVVLHIKRSDHSFDSVAMSADGIKTGQWNSIVGTVNLHAKKAAIYINGTVQRKNISIGDDATLINLGGGSIGKGTGGDPNCPLGTGFSGLIDEVNIYSQALSFAQIQQHYAQGLIKHQLARN